MTDVRHRAVVGVLLLAALLAGCGGEDGGRSEDPETITVPEDAATIQEAVDQADPGDTVVVSAGTYEESVTIGTPRITLRGLDRNEVVIDGGGLKSNGVVVTAADVTVANLTVRDFNLNGVLVTGMSDENGGLARGSDGYQRLDPEKFPPLDGFAVRYVTAHNNGLYGIYAFDAQDGVIEQSYASGHADSGIYVGQCQSCGIVVRDNVAEFNAVGYEQANASSTVTVVGNRFSDNRVGLTLLSDYQEAFVPQREGVVAGNLIADNAEAATPAQADGGFGVGLGISGGLRNQVVRNRITGHPVAGIALSSSEDIAPEGNALRENLGAENRVDVWYAASERAPGSGNCLARNRFGRTTPVALERRWECPQGGAKAPGRALAAGTVPAGISFRDVAPPPPQPQLPDTAIEVSPGAPSLDENTWKVPSTDLFADRARGGS